MAKTGQPREPRKRDIENYAHTDNPSDVHDILKAKSQPRKRQRIGFMVGEIEVPEDFDTMGGEDIREMFERGS